MREISMSAALREVLQQILQDDDRAFLMGEDIAAYGGAFKITRGFVDQFGAARVRNTPMSEAGFVAVACGAALAGSRPVVEIMFMDFLPLAFDAIINVAAKWRHVYGDDFRMPLVIRCPAGGGRSYGPTHSQSFEGMLLNVPKLTICCPSNPADAGGLLLGAHAADGPVVFIEPKALYARKGPVPQAWTPQAPGRARVVRGGTDVTLISYGRQLWTALAAADRLQADGVSAQVLDLRTLRPLDTEAITAAVAATGRGMSIEESPVCGGVGAEVAAVVMAGAFSYLEAPFVRLGAHDGPIPCSPALEQACFPDVDGVVSQARRLCAY